MVVSNASNEASIKRTIARYFDALNHSDVEAVLKLYANDPVMLPFLQPTVAGTEAVRQNYESTFQHIRFQVQTSIHELVEMSPQWAYVRTESAGTFTPASTQKGSPATFHELFLLRKSIEGEWLIARYSFSPTAELPAL
jgi:uncharacterized protein (TIGR02246 family)